MQKLKSEVEEKKSVKLIPKRLAIPHKVNHTNWEKKSENFCAQHNFDW